MHIAKRANKIIRRLPKASEIVPIIGENRNCIEAYDADNKPAQKAASAMFWKPKSNKRSGIIGNIIPIPIVSKITVQNIKTKAFLL